MTLCLAITFHRIDGEVNFNGDKMDAMIRGD